MVSHLAEAIHMSIQILSSNIGEQIRRFTQSKIEPSMFCSNLYVCIFTTKHYHNVAYKEYSYKES